MPPFDAIRTPATQQPRRKHHSVAARRLERRLITATAAPELSLGNTDGENPPAIRSLTFQCQKNQCSFHTEANPSRVSEPTESLRATQLHTGCVWED